VTSAKIRGTLLDNGAINGDATMEHVTPSNVTNRITAGNGVSCAVLADG
jgi:hypothetical protein